MKPIAINFKEWLCIEAAMSFGAHRGKEVSEVPTDYLKWALKNVATLHPDLKKDIEQSLVQRTSQQGQPPRQTQQSQDPSQVVMPFGKFRGKTLGEVMATGGKGWLTWAVNRLKNSPGLTDQDWEKYPLGGKPFGLRTAIEQVLDGGKYPPAQHVKPETGNEKVVEPEVEKVEPEKNETGKPLPQDVRIAPERMTVYNKKIEEKFLTSDKGVMIDALAGTGKTTMLKHLSSFVKPGERWLYLVFGKRNQVESSTEFPSGIDILTTHAFLGQLLKKNGKSVGGDTTLSKDMKQKKIGLVLDKLVSPSWPKSVKNFTNKKGQEQSPFNYKAKSIVLQTASLAKNTAHNPNDSKIKDQLKTLINKFAIDTDLSSERTPQDRDYTPEMIEKVIELMKFTLPGGLDKNLGLQEIANMRDQDDTLWYAALNADNMNWSMGYKVVLMDEVQDFNKCQLIMAKKLKEAGARVIGVGDKNQSMYLFRGSDSDAFEEFKNIIGDEKPSELPINFRSGGNLIDWVNKHTIVTNLQSPDHLKGKGEVYAAGGTRPPIGYSDFMTQINDEWQKNPEDGKRSFKEETCIISRTNAPLAHAAFQLLKNNINFEIIGKDLSKDLIKHIKMVTWNKPEEVEIDDLPNKLGNYFEQLKDKWGHKISKKDELKEMEEYTDTLNSVLQYLYDKEYKETPESQPIENAKGFMDFIVSKMGGRDPDSVEDMNELKALKKKNPNTFITLTTAHKCKGFEWDRTFLLKPKDYNPDNPKNKTEEQKGQEKNTFYVAATRAAKSLYISNDDEP